MTTSPPPASLTFDLIDLDLDLRGEPRVEINLHRQVHEDAPARGEGFEPLRIPEHANVLLGGPLPNVVAEADVDLRVDLEAGQHLLHLGDGVPVLAIVEPGSQAEVKVALGSGPRDESELQHLDVRFSPALTLHNLVGAAAALAETTPILRRLPDPLRAVIELGAASADHALSLELRGLTLTTRVDGHERWIQPALHGSLRLVDRLALPLDAFPIPHALLPTIHPGILALLQSPLAATIRGLLNEEFRAALTTALTALVARVTGKLRAKIRPPAFSLGYTTGDGTHRQIDIAVDDTLTLEGTLTAEGQGDTLEGQGVLTLTSAAGQGTLSLTLSAHLDREQREPQDALAPRGQDRTRNNQPQATFIPGLRDATVEVDLAKDSTLPPLNITLWQENPLCSGRSSIDLRFDPCTLEGGLRLNLATERLTPTIIRTLHLATRLHEESSKLTIDAGDFRAENPLDGALDLTLAKHPEGLRWDIDFSGEVEHDIEASLTPIAEFDLQEGTVHGRARSTSHLHLRPTFRLSDDNATRIDLDQSSLSIALDIFELTLDRRTFTLPQATEVKVTLHRGGLTPHALLPATLDLSWDLHGEPFLLHFGDRHVSLFTADLRAGNLTADLDEAGKLSFSGGRNDGLYGIRYFQALLNPGKDLATWYEIFKSDDAIRHVVDALSIFSEELAENLCDLRQLALAGHRILRREGIVDPKNFIPRQAMARVFSLLLVGDASLQDELIPILKHATEGHGLPLAAIKNLLHRELGEFEVDYEIDVILNWLHRVLKAGNLYPPAEAIEEPPLVLDPRHREILAELPSAREIYGRVEAQTIDVALSERLADLAPHLDRDQLAYLLRHSDAPGWTTAARHRLRYVSEIKERVARISTGYGGIEYATQPYTIGAFIGEAIGPLPGINSPAEKASPTWPPPSALGAEDVAILLQAGLAMARQDQRAQLNNRLLLESMRSRGSAFTREVFIELGQQSRRALSGILYAFIEQDQDQLQEPEDLVAFLRSHLDLEIPRQQDFLAGGRRARESYYQALDDVAARLIADADAYLARKQHLQEMRHPLPPPPLVTSRKSADKASKAAQAAIAKADALGAQCLFSGKRKGPQKRAQTAYRRAFASCADFLKIEPRGFTLNWFKRFWWRNEAALRVLASVRAYQEDLDDVRSWLAVQEGKNLEHASEQALVDAFISALFYEDKTRDALDADPLVRLLIDPPEGRYDFSIVSCMGVITDGQEGTELQGAFDRLAQRRGIRIIRAATGNGRSLEYNAQKIIEAIETCDTPWGIVGYSQGCTNALLAEHRLYTGPPDKQALTERLVCRNLLLSAANGSAHGSSAMEKFSRAMVAGERILKHYQATLSWEAVRIALRTLRAILDSPAFVDTLGGGDSLSFGRARHLHRDGQFLPTVPTSHSRAIVEEDRLPEALEYVFYCLKEMSGGGKQDTQVLITDAIGAATRVANVSTRAFAACDMGSPVLASHHWAPLADEVAFVETPRDKALAVYDGPKDQLVWPWVEVNARFGRIERKTS
ncbi:MAG: hypothetical protein KAI47_19105 [Deltaproteobacteria bacterium]|nr:hypothetical protein [Deltaproteobacteria bacterium]